MANNPFDREVINPRERPLSGDINSIASFYDATLRQMMRALYRGPSRSLNSANTGIGYVKSGFQADAFMPVANGTDKIKLVSGVGFINDPTDIPASISGIVGLDDTDPYKPLVLTDTAAESVTGITIAPSPVNSRIDIIEVKTTRLLGSPTSRDILNPGTGIFAPGVVNKKLSFTLDGTVSTNCSGGINVKQGVPAVSPVEPATDAGYTKIAAIRVPNGGAALIPQLNVIDYRQVLLPGGRLFISGNFIPGPSVDVTAPPGVKATFGLQVSPPDVFVYIVAGGSSGAGVSVGSMDVNSGAAGALIHFDSAFHNGFVGAANFPSQANLSGAQVPILCDNGQPIIQVKFQFDALGGSDFFCGLNVALS